MAFYLHLRDLLTWTCQTGGKWQNQGEFEHLPPVDTEVHGLVELGQGGGGGGDEAQDHGESQRWDDDTPTLNIARALWNVQACKGIAWSKWSIKLSLYLQVLNHKVSADMESLAKRASQLSSQFGDRFVSDYTEKINQIEQECKQAMRMKHWMHFWLLSTIVHLLAQPFLCCC